MPSYEIKVTKRPDIEVPKFTPEQMREFGETQIASQGSRLAEGRNVLDQAAPPLQEQYARKKKSEGKQPIRDLKRTGNLLGSVQVTEATDERVLVKVRGTTPYVKGIVNQNRDPWFGASPSDEHNVFGRVNAVFGQNVSRLGGS